MNLLKPVTRDMPLAHFRRKQYDQIPYFIEVVLQYVIANGANIDKSSVKIELVESPLAKDYKYSGTHHSAMLLDVMYDKIQTQHGSELLVKPCSLINTHIPKLQNDDVSFILNGSRYIPMMYLTDQPLSYKRNSVSLESLFCNIILDFKSQKVIMLGSFLELFDFLRIFFDDSEISNLSHLIDGNPSKSRAESLNDVHNILGFNNIPVQNLESKLNILFFDNWTIKLYDEIYGMTSKSLKEVILHLFNFLDVEDTKPSFVDLNHKRLIFIETLLAPIFTGVTNLVKRINANHNNAVFMVLNTNNAIISHFTGELSNSTLYESANNFSSLTVFKASYRLPGSMVMPKDVASIHPSYEGVICPVSVSNTNSGQIVTFTTRTIIDDLGTINTNATKNQKQNPIVSTGLSSIGFISSTDATRLQMAAKQLAQALTHDCCDIPYIIGEEHTNVAMNEGLADDDGTIVYVDDRVLVVLYDNLNKLKTFEVPEYKRTRDKLVIHRRWTLSVDVQFKKHELLYEYDSTKHGIVSYGYNLRTAFMPLMGFTCEDAVVISESASRKMRHREMEIIQIPIFPFMVVHQISQYSKYGIIAEIGEEVDSDELLRISIINNSKQASQVKAVVSSLQPSQYSIRKSISRVDITIKTRLHNIKLHDVRVHTNVDKWCMDDKATHGAMTNLLNDKLGELLAKAKVLKDTFGKKYAAEILFRHHTWQHAKPSIVAGNSQYKLQGVIELTLLSDNVMAVGDKVSNRVAGKGTIATILPDNLMPMTTDGEPLEYITNPMGVFNRINFAQLTEILISKVIKWCEGEVISDESNTLRILTKLAGLSRLLDNIPYAIKLEGLMIDLDVSEFRESVINSGMYFEVKCFTSLNLEDIIEYITREFGLDVNEDIIIPKELYTYINNRYGCEYSEEDVTANAVFTGPMYILVLMHLASHKLNARDFGSYSQGSNTPSSRSGTGSKASKIGGMEMDALLGHACINAVREIRSVKSSALELKPQLIEQILNKGHYNLPDDITGDQVLNTVTSLIKVVSSRSS